MGILDAPTYSRGQADAAFVSRMTKFRSGHLRGTLPKVCATPLLPSPNFLSVVTSTSGGTIAAGQYMYRVSATSAAGETVPSMANRATTTGSTSSVAVHWPQVPGATGYKVYRSVGAGGAWGTEQLLATIGSGSTLTYTDTGGVTPSGAMPTSNATSTTVVTIGAPTTTSPATGTTASLSVLDKQKFTTYGAPLALDVNNKVGPGAYYTLTSPPPFFAEWLYNESWFVLRGSGGTMTLMVDGEFIHAQPFMSVPCVPSDGNNYYYRFDFPDKRQRKLTAIFQNMRVVDIIVPVSASVQATPPRTKRGVVLGDSITEPTITDNMGNSNLTVVSGTLQGSSIFDGLGYAQMLNFLFPDWDMRAAGLGGTGYINPNAGAGRVKLRDRLAADIIPQQADAYFHLNGINDGSYGYSAVLAEARLVFQAIKAGVPNAEQWVCGPFWARQASSQSAGNLQVRDALEDAATAEGLPFVDLNDLLIPYGTTRPSLANGAVLTASAAASANNFQSSVPIAAGVFVKIGHGDSGGTNPNVVFTGGSSGSGPYTVSISGGVMPSAHASGEPIRLYGPSHITGIGNQGAPTGVGNSDRITSADNTHPTSTYILTGGHTEIAKRAALCLASIAPAA